MISRTINGNALAVTFVLLGVAFFVMGVYSSLSYACHARWSSSGMQPRYGWWAGCQVYTKEGLWIPEQNYIEHVWR